MTSVTRDSSAPPSLDLERGGGEPSTGSRSWRTHLPEPAHLWIRYSPRGGRGWRSWPGPDRPWMDLARGGRLVWQPGKGELPTAGGEPLDDVVVVPPVAAKPDDTEQVATRQELIRHHASHGTPVLDQRLLAGPDSSDPSSPEGVRVVFDLVAPLLEEDPVKRLERCLKDRDSPGDRPAVAVWPLLPGITDRPGLMREGCRLLSDAGVSAVQGVCPPLGPADRRRLADGRDESVFQALFHRPPPEPRGFAREAWRHGLSPFLERPLPRPPMSGRTNRYVAGWLALTAELWHRLDRPAARGQELFRVAREIDRTTWDLAALAREGNLGVLTWLPDDLRPLVEEVLDGPMDGGLRSGSLHRRPRLLDELWIEYLE